MKKLAVFAVLALAVVAAWAQLTEREEPTDFSTVQTQPTTDAMPTWFVAVTNFPNPQQVAGTVNVGNLPETQAVNGSVEVSNLPAVQEVSGAVDVTFPAVQEVAGEVAVSNLSELCGGENYAVLQVDAIPYSWGNWCGEIVCRRWNSAPFETAGWKTVAVQAVGANDAHSAVSVAFRNFPTDLIGISVAVGAGGNANVAGAEGIATTDFILDTDEISHFSVYLSR